MPKFYCSHCGHQIDALDKSEKSDISCPACSSKLKIPQLSNTTNSTSSNKPKKKSTFWSSRSFKASIAAGVISLIFILLNQSPLLKKAGLSYKGFAVLLGETIGVFIFCASTALIVAIIIAGSIAIFKKGFTSLLSWNYSIGVFIISGLVLCSSFLPSSSAPTHSRIIKSLQNNISGIESDTPSSDDAQDLRELMKAHFNDTILPSSSPPSRSSILKSLQNNIPGIESDIQMLKTELTNPDGSPRRTDLHFDSETPSSDQVEEARELMQAYFNNMIKFQNDYIQTLEDNGLNMLLDPSQLEKDKEFKNSRISLEKIKQTILDTRLKGKKILDDFSKSMDSHRKNYNLKPRSNHKSLQKSRAAFKEMWDLELEAVEHMEDLIDHLEATRLHWKTDEGMFTFERKADLTGFYIILNKVKACEARQIEIRKKSWKLTEDSLKHLKKLLSE